MNPPTHAEIVKIHRDEFQAMETRALINLAADVLRDTHTVYAIELANALRRRLLDPSVRIMVTP